MAYCHFDDNNNNYITADQRNSIRAHFNDNPSITDPTVTKHYGSNLNASSAGTWLNWLAITPTELDRANNVLYISGANDEIFRISDVFNPAGGTIHKFTIADMSGGKASSLKLSPNNPTTLYVGTTAGRVLSIPNANTTTSATPTANIKSYANCNCYVSSIDIKKTGTSTDNEAVFSYSNYNQTGIWYTTNIAASSPTFTAIDNPYIYGDIPIRSVLFAPTGNSQGIKMLIGTELGVYTTDSYSAGTTPWVRFPANRGMPYVRVDMLKRREIDNEIVAATFGRGLMRTDMFSIKKVDFSVTSTGSHCPMIFTSDVSGYGANYTREWEVWYGDPSVKVASATGNTFTLPCWSPDMIVYLKIKETATNTIAVRIARPIYYMVNSVLSCQACSGGKSRTKGEEITLYPNPSTDGIFYCSFPEEVQSISIFDMSGKEVLHQTQAAEISLQNHPAGIYFYQILTQGNEIQTGKLIKE